MYDLPPEIALKVPKVCASLEQALDCLREDHAFLTKGGVFSEDFLESYMVLKEEELTRFRMTTHPVEFDMYYTS
jgi:glutamine synthetase